MNGGIKKLFLDVLESKEEAEFACTTPDCIEGLNYVISTLPALKQSVLNERYNNWLTYEIIGKKHGFTRSYAQTLAVAAIKDLRKPELIEYIRSGYKAVQKALEEEKQLQEEKQQQHITFMKEHFWDAPITELNLNARAKRLIDAYVKTNGELTIGELDALPDECYYEIKTCGVGTINNIRNAITELRKKYGVYYYNQKQ